jgi:iron complex outermembrane receptor protein
MKKIFVTMVFVFALINTMFSQTVLDTTKTIQLDEVSVTSFYQTQNVESANELEAKTLIQLDNGQEPSFLFRKFPSIIAFSDNGTEFGYGYFRIRGLDQTRINATLDGMPWNEAEDFGIYFANSPDLMSSMHNIKVERGSISSNNGIAGYAGGVALESSNLLRDTISYGYMGYGSFDTWRTSIIYNSGKVGKNAIHLKATNSQTNGYKDNAWNRSQAFTLKAGHYFNDRHSLEFLSMNGQHRNNQGWIGCDSLELALNPRANGNTDQETDHWIQSVNKLTYKGWLSNNVVFTSSAYLQFQTGEYRFDLDNYMHRMCADLVGTLYKFPDGHFETVYTPYDSCGAIYDYGLTHYMYGNMSAVQFYLGDVKLTTGYNVYRYQRRHYMDNTLNIVNVGEDEYYDNTGYKNDASAFVSANYSLGRFDFNGNVQYRYVDFTYKDNINPNVQYNEDTRWNFVNGGLGVDYNLNPYHKVYGRWTLTHREPTRTDMFDGNEYYPENTYYEITGYGDTLFVNNGHYITTKTPERVNDFEIGYDINTDKFDANLNFYYMDFKNERVLNGEFGLNGLPCHETAERSFRAGVEYNMDWNITKNLLWSFNGAYSYNKMNTEKYGITNHILTPTWTINNDLSYNFGKLKLGVSEYFRYKMYVNMTNTLEVPEYFSLNVYGNYRINCVELGVRLNNITNRTNYQYGAEGPEGLLYFQEAKFNAFGDVKIFF